MIDFSQPKETLFAELKANKDILIAAKKAEIKNKSSVLGFWDSKNDVVKGLPNMEEGYIYPIISNTNYFDSHHDVHVNGSMTKTAKEQNKKVYYVADHSLTVDNIIATPKNVEIQLVKVKWTDIGFDYSGETEVLIFKIALNKIIHDKFLKLINDDNDLQNSIRMEYVNISMGINSNDQEYKEEKATYDEVYNIVANKAEMNEAGFCWAVKELKIKMEGSCVLFGSNNATTIQRKDNAVPSDDTEQTEEPTIVTQKTNRRVLI